MKLVALAVALAAGLTACGRSSPDPCRGGEGLACEGLAAERTLEQADFDAAIAALDPAAVRREGECVQFLVAEQLEQRCIADPCVELCALHPCQVRDPSGAPSADDCATRCSQEVDENGIPRAALDAAILRAAEEPTLCSCAVCDEATVALCEQLWVCAPDV